MAGTPDYRDDRSLTLAAKGLFAILLKRQEDQKNQQVSGDLSIREIVRLTDSNESAVKQAIKELENKNRLKRLQDGNSMSIGGVLYNL